MKRHVKLVGILFSLVIAMFGFGFALVPIYNTLCKTLGINGKVYNDSVAYDENKIKVQSREITVEFLATKNGSILWDFYPKTQKIRVHPGEIARLSFYAENKSNYVMTVQAIPSITPGIAAKYMKKTECFCFTRQTLNAHEAMDMPLLFYVDTDLPEKVKTITLAYTLFDVTGTKTPTLNKQKSNFTMRPLS